MSAPYDKPVKYIQAPEFSREEFLLGPGGIAVTERVAGLERRREFAYADLQPVPEVTYRRFLRFVIVPLVVGIACGAIAWLALRQSFVPQVAAIFPAMFVVLSLLHAIKGAEPVETTIFRGRNETVLFRLFRPPKKQHAYEDFIATLRDRIDRAQQIDGQTKDVRC